ERPRAVRTGGREARDDLLTFLEVPAQHLGGGAVADAEREGHRLGFAVRVEDPDAPGVAATAERRRVARAAAVAARELLVLRALLGREDLANLRAGGLADLRGARLALALGKVPQRRHLLPRLGQDRVELLLLLGAEPEAGHEPLPHLTRRATGAGAVAAGRRSAARRAALTARGPRRTGVGAGGPEAQRRVRHLQHARLLGVDELHVGGHPGQEAAAGIVDRDHDGVGDDVLNDQRRLADLRDDAHERLAGERVDGEARAVLELDAPDVRLID